MAKRAILYDQNNTLVGYRSFAEIDDYMARGWVERLTPIRSSVHVFRLVDALTTMIQRCRRSACSLNARINAANAGACERPAEIFWARRKVRVWPYVGDRKAPRIACRT